MSAEGEARQRIGDPLHLEPLAEHALRPECGRAIGVSKCCGWCRRAPTAQLLGRAQLGTSPPLTSRVRRAAGGAKGPRAPRGYSRIMVRPASASAHPTLHRWRWLLILNMVPGARGLALASMVPRVSKTYIAYFHQQPRGHPPFIDPHPSTTPLLKRVPASSTCAVPGVPSCFFSCTGLRLSSSLYRPSAPRWVGSVTHGGAPRRAGRNCSFFLAPTPRPCFP